MNLFNPINRLLIKMLASVALIAIFLSPVHADESKVAKQPSSSDLVFMVEFNIKPQSRAAFLDSLGQVIEGMSKEDAFITTYLHQDSQDPNKFVIYERWNEPSLQDFMENQLHGKRYRDEYETKLPSWSSKPRQITILKPLGQ